jgi:uncharacterized protein YjbJ (UPF0337 family)
MPRVGRGHSVSPVTVPVGGQRQLVEDLATDQGDKDLATEGADDRLKGAAKRVEGRVRGTVGAAKGDPGEQVKGKAQEITGTIQQEIGKAKQRLDLEPGVDEH